MGIAGCSVLAEAHSEIDRVPNAELGCYSFVSNRSRVVPDSILARSQFVIRELSALNSGSTPC